MARPKKKDDAKGNYGGATMIREYHAIFENGADITYRVEENPKEGLLVEFVAKNDMFPTLEQLLSPLMMIDELAKLLRATSETEADFRYMSESDCEFYLARKVEQLLDFTTEGYRCAKEEYCSYSNELDPSCCGTCQYYIRVRDTEFLSTAIVAAKKDSKILFRKGVVCEFVSSGEYYGTVIRISKLSILEIKMLMLHCKLWQDIDYREIVCLNRLEEIIHREIEF